MLLLFFTLPDCTPSWSMVAGVRLWSKQEIRRKEKRLETFCPPTHMKWN
jgi:hypothetical protein